MCGCQEIAFSYWRKTGVLHARKQVHPMGFILFCRVRTCIRYLPPTLPSRSLLSSFTGAGTKEQTDCIFCPLDGRPGIAMCSPTIKMTHSGNMMHLLMTILTMDLSAGSFGICLERTMAKLKTSYMHPHH